MKRKPDLFYGWIVVAGAAVIMAVTLGVTQNCTGLFITYIGEDLGQSRQSVQAIMTFFSLGCVATSALSPWLYRRIGVMVLMRISAVAVPCLYSTYAMIQNMSLFYGAAFLLGSFVTFTSVLPLAIIITNWFNEKRGVAIGAAFMGSSIGGAAFNALAGQIIALYGWHAAIFVLAAVMALLIIPVTFFVICYSPKKKGLLPYGEKVCGTQKSAAPEQGEMLAELWTRPSFWIFLIAVVLCSVCSTNVNIMISPHLSDLGYGVKEASLVVSAAMVCLTCGKLILGVCFDRAGLRATLLISQVAILVAICGLLNAGNPWFLSMVVLGVGFGCGYTTSGYPIMTEAYFGKKDYKSVYGVVTMSGNVGNMLAPILSGAAYDINGSYHISFILLAAFCVAELIVFLAMSNKRRRAEKFEHGR